MIYNYLQETGRGGGVGGDGGEGFKCHMKKNEYFFEARTELHGANNALKPIPLSYPFSLRQKCFLGCRNNRGLRVCLRKLQGPPYILTGTLSIPHAPARARCF